MIPRGNGPWSGRLRSGMFRSGLPSSSLGVDGGKFQGEGSPDHGMMSSSRPLSQHYGNIDPELFQQPSINAPGPSQQSSFQLPIPRETRAPAPATAPPITSVISPGLVDDQNFIITPTKRMELRQGVAKGKRLAPTPEIKPASETGYVRLTSNEMKSYAPKFDHAIRWNMLLTHAIINAPDIIHHTFGARLDLDSADYYWARQLIIRRRSHYKSKTLKNFRTLIKSELERKPWLEELSDDLFSAEFENTFNNQNYFSCFFFMKSYLNIEGSSEFGKWFLKSIYINIGVSVRKYIKAGETKNAWKKVRRFWDEVALLPQHDQVDITDFQQLNEGYGSAERILTCDFAGTQEEYIQFAPPPKKARQAIEPSDVRTAANARMVHDQDDERLQPYDPYVEAESLIPGRHLNRQLHNPLPFWNNPPNFTTPYFEVPAHGGTTLGIGEEMDLEYDDQQTME